MSEIRELYQEVILDHNKKPRNFREMEAPDRKAEGHNPLCGDQVTIYLQVEDDKVKDVSFQGTGCAISTASASLMTEALKGKSLQEVNEAFERFHDLVTKDMDFTEQLMEMGKLAAFSGIRDFPMRVKCATLAWHTLKAALESKEAAVVSTE